MPFYLRPAVRVRRIIRSSIVRGRADRAAHRGAGLAVRAGLGLTVGMVGVERIEQMGDDRVAVLGAVLTGVPGRLRAWP